MSICYVVSDGFREKLVSQYDQHDARQLIDYFQDARDRYDTPESIIEKQYTGYMHLEQIRYSDWRVVAVWVRNFQLCELVQLNYVYRKNESNEPNQDILEEIDAVVERFFEESEDWPPSEESAYLDDARTQLSL